MNNLSRPAPVRQALSIDSKMCAYQVGDEDNRPWGHYVVTGVGIAANGEGYCKKVITIKPWQVLSLQSHKLRREKWTVKRGTLTALRDGQRFELSPHEFVHIPVGSIHCMANMDEDGCVVEEVQEGICHEEDIKRYMDIYRRGTETLVSPEATESFTAYRSILIDINKIRMNRMQGAPY